MSQRKEEGHETTDNKTEDTLWDEEVAQVNNTESDACASVEDADSSATTVPCEERLAKKLKTIDTLSPRSSFDEGDLSESTKLPPPTPKPKKSARPRPSPIVASRNSAFSPPQASPAADLQRPFRTRPLAAMNAHGHGASSGPGTHPSNTHMITVPPGNHAGDVRLRQSSQSPLVLPNRVTLIVDGTRFVADPQIFTAKPNTMLGRSAKLIAYTFHSAENHRNFSILIPPIFECS